MDVVFGKDRHVETYGIVFRSLEKPNLGVPRARAARQAARSALDDHRCEASALAVAASQTAILSPCRSGPRSTHARCRSPEA